MNFKKKFSLLKRKKSIFIPFILVLVLIIVLIIILRVDFVNLKGEMDLGKPSFIRYKIFPWNKYYATLSNFLLDKGEKPPPLPKELLEPQEKGEDKPSNNGESTFPYSAYFVSSLTSSPDSLGIYGETEGLEVYLDNIKLTKSKSGSFSGGSGNSFSILFKGDRFTRKVVINAPSYSTNFVLERLQLIVDPVNMVATISGKINLNLPGEIKGTFFNASNGSSNSTILKNGAFSASVSLTSGVNNLTASGSWFTIKLDLPTIVVGIY